MSFASRSFSRLARQAAVPARTSGRALRAVPLLCLARRALSVSASRWHGPLKPAMEAPGSMAPSSSTESLSAAQYDRVADEAMEALHEHLEALVEEYSPEGANGWEVEYSAGVLTMSLGPHGTYVINKQPPNQQIWVSSPFSGPMRYSYLASSQDPNVGTWTYARDNVTIGALLDREVRSVLVSEVGQEEADAWTGVGVQ